MAYAFWLTSALESIPFNFVLSVLDITPALDVVAALIVALLAQYEKLFRI